MDLDTPLKYKAWADRRTLDAVAQMDRGTSLRQKGSLSRAEVLYHLINHGTYHRGAIGHALDLAKAPRPADTYTVFVHLEEPGRREG